MDRLAFSVPGANGPVNIDPVAGMPTGGAASIQALIQFGITFLLIGATLLALAFLIWGGISWIMSAGEKEKVEEARKKITYALIGLVVVFLSFFIINTISGVFGVSLLNLSAKDKLSAKCPANTHLVCKRNCFCSPD